MVPRGLAILVVVAAVSCGGWPVPSEASSRCPYEGGLIRFTNQAVIVFGEHAEGDSDGLEACLRSNRRTVHLADAYTGGGYGSGEADWYGYRVRGHNVAVVSYERVYDGDLFSTSVRLIDIATGKTLTRQAGVSDTKALRVGPRGTMTFLSEEAPRGCAPGPALWVYDGRRARVIDSGSSIDPTSVRISRDRVSWQNDGASRTTTLATPQGSTSCDHPPAV